MVRVNPIDKSLCPRLVVLREDCVELFDREKPVEVRVGALFKELPPCGLLWAPRPFFIPCALSTDVVVAEEAVEPVVAVVGLGEDLAAGGTCVTVPGPLPASEADYLSKKKKSSLFFYFQKKSSHISGQSLNLSPHWQKTLKGCGIASSFVFPLVVFPHIRRWVPLSHKKLLIWCGRLM